VVENKITINKKGGFIMALPSGYTFVGLPSICPNSVKYAPIINRYCTIYKYNGQPLDARLVASLITAEVGIGWNTNSGSSDYATTHSAGLGQFTNATGPAYGLNTQADKVNPEKCIKAICWYYSNCLKSAGGNAKGAYEQYNGGPNGQHVSEAVRNANQNWDPAYRTWYNNSCLKKVTNSPTPALKNNNTNAVNDAKKKADAIKANAKIIATKKANDLAKANALKASQVLAKAKLTNNKNAINKAQLELNKIKLNPTKIPTEPNEANGTKAKVLKSGFGFLGIIAMVIVFKYGYDL
jgi:hypothetical protein